MRDKIGDHEDRIDAIFGRLRALEEKSHAPIDFIEQLEDFKDVVRDKIIDLDFRINELELQIEDIKQRGQPRKKKS
tara:strand:+ start:325 stop:552 length:228 start_codon:yes stop_codon:yes gene_type:complete